MCCAQETGEIYKQAADGILGLGNNINSLPSQLVTAGVIDNIFSLCFGFPDGGALLLGDVSLPAAVQNAVFYTPLRMSPGNPYYRVQLNGIAVGGLPLNADLSGFSTGYGTVLDSGTTFLYFPTAAYSAFEMAVRVAAASKGFAARSTSGGDICWPNSPADTKALSDFFPDVSLSLDNGATLVLTPLRYIYIDTPGTYCLGVFDNGPSGALIGGIAVRDTLVVYDRRNRRVGFAPLAGGCKALLGNASALPSWPADGLVDGSGNGASTEGGRDDAGATSHSLLLMAVAVFIVGAAAQIAWVQRDWLAAQAARARDALRSYSPLRSADDTELARLTGDGISSSAPLKQAAAAPLPPA